MVGALNGEDGEAAGATLRRTSRELRKVIGMVEELEQVVGHALLQSSQPPNEQMLELQKLDHIQQKILGVSDFIDALCLDMTEDWRVNPRRASRCVLLAELGAKLGDEAEFCERATAAPEVYELF